MGPRYHVSGSLIEAAIEVERAADYERLLEALEKASTRDPAFRFSSDAVSYQTIAKGASEDHLDQSLHALRLSTSIKFNIGAPQVAYREYLRRPFEIDHTLRDQRGGAGEFARIQLRGEPKPPDERFQFENEAGPSLRAEDVAVVRRALESWRENGIVMGFPMIGCKITLIDGAYHDVDSPPAVFTAATRTLLGLLKDDQAFGLLEPIMHVEAVTPDEFLGAVVGDLNARKGEVGDATSNGFYSTVRAFVPLSALFGYVNGLRSHTSGQGDCTIHYSHHEPVPLAHDPDDRFRPAAAMRMRA